MVTATDPQVIRKVRLLRNQGMEARYANEVVGFNARMSDVHAAIGRVQLRKLSYWTGRRRSNAAAFDTQLVGVIVPQTAVLATHVYHQYTIRVPGDRDGFQKELRENYGIDTGVFYRTPVHRLRSFGLDLDMPETETAADEVLSLPVHPGLSDGDVDRIITGVNEAAGAGS
jgi:dTDP-4-amino-4,6-dideoxygalactose transaminase